MTIKTGPSRFGLRKQGGSVVFRRLGVLILIYDVVIVGAGAAGFFSAFSADERGRKTLLLEKNRKTGVKILISGGTRCNITQNTDERGIVEAFGSNGKFLHSALSHLGPAQVVEWFERHAVATKIESTGKVFPVSDRALDVRNALLQRVEKSEHISLRTGCTVERIERTDRSDGARFRIIADRGDFQCSSVIIATGGKSYPGCGTTGDGYAWAESLGHTIVNPVPALTPIVCQEAWVKELKGITLSDSLLGVFETNLLERISDQNFGRIAEMSYRGSTLFTHFGLSGPAPLNVSKQFSLNPGKDQTLVIDFVPSISCSRLANELDQQQGGKTVRSLIQQYLPSNLVQQLIRLAGIEPNEVVAEISKKRKRSLVQRIKRCRVGVEGTRGFRKAEVTSGGVSLKEVNSHTMESKLCDGLYLAGEVLDLDGLIGGFNFQSAFSTGHLAGMNV